jgi:predicted porin
MLSFLSVQNVAARSLSDKYYLRIAKSKDSEKTDLDITSIGVLALQKNFVGHVDLHRLKSDINGNATTLDFGGGYVFNWDISLYLSLGVSLGYNKDNSDYLTAYYPEVGIVADITKTFGITASTRRYHHLYEENENIVMIGLVFRD